MPSEADAPGTLHDRLTRIAARDGARPALLAPGAPPLDYAGLLALIDARVRELRAMGLGREDRVCVVASGGPVLASAILTAACAGACVPLNPATAARDWAGLLSDFRVSALLVEAGMGAEARAAAAELGVPAIDLVPADDPRAGMFALRGAGPGGAADPARPTPEHDALLLPTSGTTSRPKVVPLTHANIHRSARNLAAAIGLTADDRLLNILPLHHSYGLVTGLISTVWAGAEIVCTPGFEAEGFFAALDEYRPTWTMAVPAIFSEMLAHAAARDLSPPRTLRLLHSSASPLPEQRITDVEALFGAPLIETYGMTEAASQIASNPMPPGERRLGSVGRPAGPEVRVIAPDGAPLPPGEIGEVVLHGPNLTRGYEGAPRARDWTPDGWFRTGDLGRFDADGYLFLVGRLKEMINRGGEKISPQKVEEAIAEHPDVAEAAAFPLPHPRLGEEVGVAVAPRPGARLDARGVRAFAALSNALSAAETPRSVAIVERIPRTATGKPQRLRLAAALEARTRPAGDEGQRDETRACIARILADALGVERIGDDDSFFLLGGDSLSATRVMLRLREEFGLRLDLRALFDAPTVAELADAVAAARPEAPDPSPPAAPETFAPTPAQSRILACAEGFAGLPTYNVPMGFAISGPLDAEALSRALAALVARHEALRTGFRRTAGGHVAQVAPACAAPLEMEDWSALPASVAPRFLEGVARDMAWAPFALDAPPLFRARLLRFGPETHSLLFVFHHVICDAWSIDVLLEDLSALYTLQRPGSSRGARGPAPAAPPFSTFASAQATAAQPPRDAPGLTDGAADPTAALSTGRRTFEVPPELTARLAEVAAASRCTLFTALLTAFRARLGADPATRAARVLIPLSNREAVGSAAMVGLLQDHGALDAAPPPAPSLAQALQATREAVLDLQSRAAPPFELRAAAPSADPRGDAFFSLVDAYGEALRLPGAAVAPDFRVDGYAQPVLPADAAAIFLTLVETGGRLHGALTYKTARMSDAQAERWAQDYLALLAAFAERPEAPLARLLEAETPAQ